MEEEITQSFRLDGHTEILNLPCDPDGGQNFINWDTINGVYPGPQYIKNGNNVVRKLEYTGPDGNLRHRIRHQPGVVLVVVLSNSASRAPVISPPGYSTLPSVSRQASDTPGASTDDNVVEVIGFDTSDTGICVELNRRLVVLLPPDIQPQFLDSSNVLESIIQGITSGLVRVDQPQLDVCLRELRGEVAKNNQLVSDLNEFAVKNNELTSKNNELVTDVKSLAHQNMDLTKTVIKLQKKMNEDQEKTMDQLAQIQNSIQALMTQTYELHEYPIPRLFVILPQDTSSWNPVNLIYNKFRLYFLCECGDHTKSDNSSIPHHIHFAKHEGYEIKRPNTFIQQYGQHILTILKMLKFGFSAAGVAIPGISFLMRSDALDQATRALKMLSESLPKGIDQAIESLERGTQNDDSVDGSLDQMKNKKALEGADLRKLESFLKHNDVNNVLGNLYRTVTTEGHVKWVCLDHYRELYQEEAARDFCDTVKSLEGTFNENVGRVNVRLQSKEKAEQFYQALKKARSVSELDIVLDWNATHGDFKDLRDALRKSNVRGLGIDLRYQRLTSKPWNRLRRHNPIFDIVRHPSIQSVEIAKAPKKFIERSSVLSWKEGFPNLKHMGIDLRSDTRDIKTLLSKSPKLSSLALNDPMAVGVLSLFRTLEPLEDLFESVGRRQLYLRSRIHLQSSMQAEQVYRALRKAKSLHELDIDLDWSTTQSDIERLSDFLTKSNVGSLKLRVNLKENLTGGVSNHVKRHDSVFDIMRRPFTLSVSIKGAPRDFIQQSSLLKQNDGFPSLRHMEIDLTELKEDISGIKCLIANAPDLSSLIFQGDVDDTSLLRIYMAIVEHQTCPITVASRSLCIPRLTAAPYQPLASQCVAHLLSVGRLKIDLVLEVSVDEEADMDPWSV
ncbi:hypothetical protein B0O80DRAFT_495609 [Mortierella sp. GBAus27b]|nr:hypothetical protein B0O80DRAFT_495609 [Mortierella sp. GBAus27b]